MTQVVSNSKPEIICVGDPMLDVYHVGRSSRLATEAAVPVIEKRPAMLCPGGAANLAKNIAAQGVTTTFVAPLGLGDFDKALANDLDYAANLEFLPISSPSARIVTKERFYANGNIVMRMDDDGVGTLDDQTADRLLDVTLRHLDRCRCLVLSDYAKGTLSPQTLQRLIAAARATQTEVLIDPKGADFQKYTGADCLTPNRSELESAVGQRLTSQRSIEIATHSLMARFDISTMIVTLGAEGVLVCSAKKDAHHIKQIEAASTGHVAGAGDTFLAVYASERARSVDTYAAAYRANLAAGLAVKGPFTTIVTRAEIDAYKGPKEHSSSSRVSKEPADPLMELVEQCKVWRAEGHTIGFTNGCFDLLHSGHMSLLNEAKRHCTKLVVGLNSDSSVRRLKGHRRPVKNEFERWDIMSNIDPVDAVVLFDQDTPITIIKKLRPETLIKGADYKRSDIVGADEVEGWGGSIIRVPIKPGQSTTQLIERLLREGVP